MAKGQLRTWYVHKSGEQRGPFTEEELETELARSTPPTNKPTFQNELRGESFFGGMLHHLFKDPLRSLRDAVAIVTRPAAFSREFINPSRQSFYRSLEFFITVITLLFTVFIITGPLFSWSGGTELQGLLVLTLQFGVVLLPMHFMLRLLVDRIGISETLQYALYADGSFQIAATLASTIISGIDRFSTWQGRASPNLIMNEVENCFASSSNLYWLLRGNLQFILLDDDRFFYPKLGWLIENIDYLIALPFVFAFGKMVATRHKGHWLPPASIALIAFVSASGGYVWFLGKFQERLWDRTACANTIPKTIVARYNKSEILKQIDVTINNDLADVHGDGTKWLKAQRKNDYYIIPLQGLDSTMTPYGKKIESEVKESMRKTYCSSIPTFSVMRELGQKLAIIHFDADGKQSLGIFVEPSDCRSP